MLIISLVASSKFGSNDEADFSAVAGILRLATKYIIDELREMTLEHLCVAWPSTLKTWDMREDHARIRELDGGMHHLYPHPFVSVTFIFAHNPD